MTTHHQPGDTFTGHLTGKHYVLGEFIARGGEGEVFLVSAERRLVAKLYIKPMPKVQGEKIVTLIKMRNAQLTAIAAWPQELLIGPEGKPAGYIMPFIPEGRPIHDLATPAGRLRAMPSATYSSLVRVAANLARAVATFHHAGIVLGDINGSNFLVMPNGTVRVIDCDSVQIGSSRKFRAPVAMEEFVPPELQGKRLSNRMRTANHDAFALAVMIFELLVLGRHPFSGNGDMPLGRSIRKRRHVFRWFSPPQNPFRVLNIPKTDMLSPELVALFKRAFNHRPLKLVLMRPKRPTALQWMTALEAHHGKLTTCGLDTGHQHPPGARQCPWCTLEARGAPKLFHGKRLSPVKPTPRWWERLVGQTA